MKNRTVDLHLNDVAFVRPAGNDTAIVFDQIPKSEYSFYNKKIQKHYPQIEQVMFARKNGKKIIGEMAGGEFCANATRALGYVCLEDKEDEITLNVSGLKSDVSVSVSGENACLNFHAAYEKNTIVREESEIGIISLDGITHAIIDDNAKVSQSILNEKNKKIRKDNALKLLKLLDLIDEVASGIIFTKQELSGFSIIPFVYVRHVNTLFEETACASGSLAVALSIIAKETLKTKVTQPSGMYLDIEIEKEGHNTILAKINGPVELSYRGSL